MGQTWEQVDHQETKTLETWEDQVEWVVMETQE